MTDAFYGNRVVEISADSVFDFAVEARDHAHQLESAMKVAEEALRRLHTCIDFCNGHGTPRIKDRAECYMADAEAESALRAIEKIKKGGV